VSFQQHQRQIKYHTVPLLGLGPTGDCFSRSVRSYVLICLLTYLLTYLITRLICSHICG